MRKRIAVIDLEMNQPSQSIFQIGYAIVDLESALFTALPKSFWIKLPENEVKSNFVFTDLCKVDLLDYEENARDFAVVWADFCADLKSQGIKRLGAWGGDVGWLHQAVDQKGLPWPFDRSEVNCKTTYEFWLAGTDKFSKGSSLFAAINSLNIRTGDAKLHNADTDAFLAAKVLLELLKRIRSINEVKTLLEEITK